MKGMQIIGCVVDDKTADTFRKMLPDNITSEEAVRWFVWQIATEQMHINKEIDDGK